MSLPALDCICVCEGVDPDGTQLQKGFQVFVLNEGDDRIEGHIHPSSHLFFLLFLFFLKFFKFFFVSLEYKVTKTQDNMRLFLDKE